MIFSNKCVLKKYKSPQGNICDRNILGPPRHSFFQKVGQKVVHQQTEFTKFHSASQKVMQPNSYLLGDKINSMFAWRIAVLAFVLKDSTKKQNIYQIGIGIVKQFTV